MAARPSRARTDRRRLGRTKTARAVRRPARARPLHLAIAALAIACAVELSQLYRAPWIDALRATRGGALVLGHGFLWSDLASYAAGVVLAAAIDAAMVRRLRLCAAT